MVETFYLNKLTEEEKKFIIYEMINDMLINEGHYIDFAVINLAKYYRVSVSRIWQYLSNTEYSRNNSQSIVAYLPDKRTGKLKPIKRSAFSNYFAWIMSHVTIELSKKTEQDIITSVAAIIDLFEMKDKDDCAKVIGRAISNQLRKILCGRKKNMNEDLLDILFGKYKQSIRHWIRTNKVDFFKIAGDKDFIKKWIED